jgi:hypothetical protein
MLSFLTLFADTPRAAFPRSPHVCSLTGRMGLLGNLTTAQVVDQVVQVRRHEEP